MTDWNLGFTALRIAKLFAESTTKKLCCADITKQLEVPQQTVWNALQSMTATKILTHEKDWDSKKAARVVYCFTQEGFATALEALAAVRFNGTIILPSSS